MGAARRSVTTYEYQTVEDPSGHLPSRSRLSRAVTVNEPRFDDDDITGALERAEEKALTCSGCGHPVDEVYPRDADHALELDSLLYADTVTCVACGKAEKKQRELKDPVPGTRVIVRRRDD